MVHAETLSIWPQIHVLCIKKIAIVFDRQIPCMLAEFNISHWSRVIHEPIYVTKKAVLLPLILFVFFYTALKRSRSSADLILRTFAS